ncbi:gliding motility lipoprotein GldD [Sphingobacterium bambusae]|uniref:Gliding motility lipoprotein GldD n=1 Tax=Sphingobacterium bambusae TaxID=662858 RepID=A0ABW6BAP3_9SPHI|nr:gliding motility lipoprotein GldD [Sphingobacterium bambusae]WPL46756.1 gliding motility lipoprotein GldD [Sphingobacterium bambusae]
MRSVNIIFFSLVFLLFACHSADYTPKPRGFYRIDLPEKDYKQATTGCPFLFEQPTYTTLNTDLSDDAHPCWKNLDFPQFNARLHMSYFAINSKAPLAQLTEDARTFAFKHTAKATSIDQVKIHRPSQKLYGVTYLIHGNTASNLQFFVSDSSKHYLRGALYFNEKPNLDSIQPVLDFIQQDIEQLIRTFTWK